MPATEWPENNTHLEPRLPLEVTEMYFELDGTFPNHIANPIEPANIQDLINRVKTECRRWCGF